jgi:hypothetical protein
MAAHCKNGSVSLGDLMAQPHACTKHGAVLAALILRAHISDRRNSPITVTAGIFKNKRPSIFAPRNE